MAVLETFMTVARYQNIHQAAKELHLSQPAITARIHSLELQCGYKLFEKAGRGIRLTDFGKTLYPYVIHSLQILNQGMEAAKREDIHKHSTTIRIAGDTCTSMGILVQIVSYLTQNIDNIHEYKIVEIPFVRLYEELLSGSIQIALTSQMVHSPQFRTLCLYHEQALFVVQSQILKTNAVASIPFILNSNDPFFSNIQPQISVLKNKDRLSSVIYVEHQAMVKYLIGTGSGCGFLPKSVIEAELMLGHIQILPTPEFLEPKNLNCPQYIVYSTDLPAHMQQILFSFYLEYDQAEEPS